MATGSSDLTLRLWDVKQEREAEYPFKGHREPINSISFSPDGTCIASGSDDRTIRLWNVQNGREIIGPFKGHASRVTSVAFSSNGDYIVSASEDCMICVWNATTGDMIAGPLEGHTDAVYCVATFPDGKRVASGSQDRTIRVWNIEPSLSVAPPLERRGHWIWTLKFSSDGRRIVCQSMDATYHIWDVESGEVTTDSFEEDTKSMTPVAPSDDSNNDIDPTSDDGQGGNLEENNKIDEADVTASDKGGIETEEEGEETIPRPRPASGTAPLNWIEGLEALRITDPITNRILEGPFKDFDPTSLAGELSPDGKFLATAEYGFSIIVTRYQIDKVVAGPFEGHTGRIRSVAFSSNGECIVTGADDQTVHIWNIKTGNIVAGPLEGHTGSIMSVAFSHDGKRVLSGSNDRTIRIWDAETGQQLGEPLEGHTYSVTTVAFSPDGKLIPSGSKDMMVRLWDAEVDEMRTIPSEEEETMTASPEPNSSNDPDLQKSIGDTGLSKFVNDKEASARFTSSSRMINGWILGANSELLFWVPPELHPGLFRPGNRFVFGRATKTRLHLESFVHGKSWTSCKNDPILNLNSSS
ncbi:WD40 repeat-like protein [Serendipita vermifera]|nr:WD40 repeat-like protein [Serendipita vermifera]